MTTSTTMAAIIGCGNISDIYFQNGKVFDILDITACADLVPERAQAKSEQYECKALSVDEVLADPSIKIIINLTIPIAHAEVAFKAVDAGKSVHNEKPLTITREDGRKLHPMYLFQVKTPAESLKPRLDFVEERRCNGHVLCQWHENLQRPPPSQPGKSAVFLLEFSK